MKYHYVPIQLLKLKSLTSRNTFEDTGQLEFSFMADQKVNHFQRLFGSFLKGYLYLPYVPEILLLEIFPNRFQNMFPQKKLL